MPLQVPQGSVITETGVTTPDPLAVPEHYATVRANPITGAIDVLGVVGSKYEPVQNEASCALLNALTDESGAVFERRGPARGARSVRDHEAAAVDDLRRQRRQQGPNRFLPRSPEFA